MYNFYFAGAEIDATEGLLENINKVEVTEINVLKSQLNERKQILKWIDYIDKNTSKCKINLFVDCGAFTAWTLGKTVDIDDYIDFINKYDKYFKIYASLDVIPGSRWKAPTPEDIQNSIDGTWENYLYMRKKVKTPSKLVFTYHMGEPISVLTKALEYSDDLGRIEYLAIGCLVGKSPKDVCNFLSTVFEVIKNSSNPNIKVHGFGLGNRTICKSFPLTSSDSTGALLAAATGNILINATHICVSELQKFKFDKLSTASKDEIISTIESRGFTLEELSTNRTSRLAFNMLDTLLWCKNYKCQELTVNQYSLW